MIKEIVDDLQNKAEKSMIALRFHITIRDIVSEVCKVLRRKIGVDKVVLSGGVFQNILLLELIYSSLKEEGFGVYTHSRVPTNDEGISVGQVAIANALI